METPPPLTAKVQLMQTATIVFPNLAACVDALPDLIRLNRPDSIGLSGEQGYAFVDPRKPVELRLGKNATVTRNVYARIANGSDLWPPAVED